MKLSALLKGIEVVSSNADFDEEITGVTVDSRKVQKGNAFICISGTKYDGHLYIEDAVKNGAGVIITQKDIDNKDIKFVHVTGGRKTVAEISCNFYENPSKEFKLIGVTGTKGKTTTTYMIKSILEEKGLKVGIIGTIESKIGDIQIKTSENTTPEATELQGLFRKMANEKVDAVVMEVSSHSLDLDRVYGTAFAIAAFTNLSQDHMDYHENFENYFNAKKKLFSMCKKAIINIDDGYGERLYREVECDKESFSIDKKGDVTAGDIKSSSENVAFAVEGNEVRVKIPGRFSVYNALTAICVAKELGCSFSDIENGFDKLVVPGRSEVIDIGADFTVLVDYAHSPDSLKNILLSVKEYAKGNVICVFGCGGDRDKTKRPIMGEIASELSDIIIVTSDNPRSEDPEEIINEIEEGLKKSNKSYLRVPDRADAIYQALKIARKDDVVIIAGKGHEPYQILKTGTIHFDDREQVKIQYQKLL